MHNMCATHARFLRAQQVCESLSVHTAILRRCAARQHSVQYVGPDMADLRISVVVTPVCCLPTCCTAQVSRDYKLMHSLCNTQCLLTQSCRQRSHFAVRSRSVKQSHTRLSKRKYPDTAMFVKQNGVQSPDKSTARMPLPAVPFTPLSVDPQTHQHKLQLGMTQLASSLNSKCATTCHAALQQIHSALLSIYCSNEANREGLSVCGMPYLPKSGLRSQSKGLPIHDSTAHHLNYMLAGWHEQIALSFLSAGHPDWLSDYIAMLPTQLDDAIYIRWIKACGQHGNAAALQDVTEARVRAGYAHNKYSVTSMMAAWQKAGQTRKAMSVFEEAVWSEVADVEVCNAAIAICVNSKQTKAAFSIFATMAPRGLKPSLITFHTLLKDPSYLKAAGLRDLYAQMMATEGLLLTEVTFHYVFRAAYKCTSGLPAAWLFQVLADMPKRKVPMNSYILTAFFQACCGVVLTTQETEAAFAAAASYRANQPATAFVYSALLTFCAKKAPDRALDVWHALQEDGVEVTAHLLSSLFAACAASELPDMLELAEGCHMHLEGLWNKICGKGKTHAEERDMLQAHNALLHVYASHSRVGKAEQLYAGMQERGPDVDALSAASLIAAYAKVGNSQSALQTFDDMRQAGLQPTSRCMTSLLAACARAGDLTAARRVFQGMGPARNVPAYTALMDACLKNGSPAAYAEAFQVFQDMKADRLQPTATTYGCLLMVCKHEGNVEKAFQLYKEAYSLGVLATDECHNILITICADAGRTDEALDLVKALASNHGHMEQPALNSLVRSLLSIGQVPRALRMLSIMTSKGLKPYRSTIDALIAGCARDSNSQQASAFYWDLRRHGGDASKASGSELIISLCKAGQALEALKVYDDMTAPPPAVSSTSETNAGNRWHTAQGVSRWPVSSHSGEQATSSTHPAQPAPAYSAASSAENAHTAVNASAPSAHACHTPADSSHKLQNEVNAGVLMPDDHCTAGRTSADCLSQTSPQAGHQAVAHLAEEPMCSPASVGATLPGKTSNAESSLSSGTGKADSQSGALAKHAEQKTARAVAARPDALAQVAAGSAPQLIRPPKRALPTEGVHLQPAVLPSPKGNAVRSSQHMLMPNPTGQSGCEQALGGIAGDSSAGRLELHSSTRLSQRVTFPSTSATAALVHAFALAGNLHQCHRLYQQLQRDRKGLAGLTHSHRAMWQSTIETACRAGQVDWALQIFDDWKAASMSYVFVHSAQHSLVKFPTLSNVTLAFLEACCRGSEEHTWRVYDVCAAMRQQRERKVEAKLARPFKKSHHVADSA